MEKMMCDSGEYWDPHILACLNCSDICDIRRGTMVECLNKCLKVFCDTCLRLSGTGRPQHCPQFYQNCTGLLTAETVATEGRYEDTPPWVWLAIVAGILFLAFIGGLVVLLYKMCWKRKGTSGGTSQIHTQPSCEADPSTSEFIPLNAPILPSGNVARNLPMDTDLGMEAQRMPSEPLNNDGTQDTSLPDTCLDTSGQMESLMSVHADY